jgi:hypothetical protein
LLFFPDSEAYRPGKSFSTSGLSNSILFKIPILLFRYNVLKHTWNVHYAQLHNPHQNLYLVAICNSGCHGNDRDATFEYLRKNTVFRGSLYEVHKINP